MGTRIHAVKRRHLDSLYEAVDAVARERRYFLITRAPGREALDLFARILWAADAPFFAALEGTRVVGWIDVAPGEKPALAHVGRVGMGVIASHRGQGIGERLLERALKHAFGRTGLRRVELEVYTDNRPAIALYEKLGFVPEGVRRKAARRGRALRDLVHMAMVR